MVRKLVFMTIVLVVVIMVVIVWGWEGNDRLLVSNLGFGCGGSPFCLALHVKLCPKGPCTQIVYTLAPKYLYRDYFRARVYTIWVPGPVGLTLKDDGGFSVPSKKKKKGKGKGKGSTAPRKVRCEPGTQAFADELMMDISRSSLAWSFMPKILGKGETKGWFPNR